MMRFRALIVFALVAALAAAASGLAQPANATHGRVFGVVTNATTGAPIDGVCVALEPPITCTTTTNAAGQYSLNFSIPDGLGLKFAINFLKSGQYQPEQRRDIPGDVETQLNIAMTPVAGATPPPSPTPPPTSGCAAQSSAALTKTVYLPNITKTLGGADGWQTPFIVQNTGAVATDLEVTFNSFATGACVLRKTRAALQPGTSQSYSPNDEAQLPADSQFSVIIKSFGADVVAVVNQHQAVQSATRAEALSYVGFSSGGTSVFLPNVVRRFFGFHSPFIMQNLGTAPTTATAVFRPFDGTASVTSTRSISPGQSAFIEPDVEPGLIDGKQYAVTVTATQPIAVVVNTHNDAPTVAEPVAYSANGIASGAATVYGPYAAKNTDGVGRVSTIVVQNLGAGEITPSITFTRLNNVGTPVTFVKPTPLAAGAGWAFDPRFQGGDSSRTLCTPGMAECLEDGEWSFVATAPGGFVAAAVNVLSAATAMGYTASATPASRFFLPNVLRTFCFCPDRGRNIGWTTPIYLQSAGATGATVTWRRFSDGVAVTTQTLSFASGTGVKIDPRDVAGLSDDTQYAVEVTGTGGLVAAIVVELKTGGDNAMIYEGFPAP